ncbi:hypothetical protein KAI87_12100 [Myxococcota bacterium]|nr:hypothetical protein [Myxococcota bacterium]
MKKYLILTLFFGLGSTLSACGSTDVEDSIARDLCEATVDCEGGSGNDVEDCVAGVESDIEEAEEYGCTDEHNEILDCFVEDGYCDADDHYVFGEVCVDDYYNFTNCLPDDYGEE